MKMVVISILILMSAVLQADTNTTKSKKKIHKVVHSSASHKAANDGHKLSTNVDFDDQLVNGKYEYPDEAIATVEDDKLLNDLLAVRKNFKDRLKQTEARN